MPDRKILNANPRSDLIEHKPKEARGDHTENYDFYEFHSDLIR